MISERFDKIAAEMFNLIRNAVSNGSTAFVIDIEGSNFNKDFIKILKYNLIHNTKVLQFLIIFETKNLKNLKIIFLGSVAFDKIFIFNCKTMLLDFEEITAVDMDIFTADIKSIKDIFVNTLLVDNNICDISWSNSVRLYPGLFYDSLLPILSEKNFAVFITQSSFNEEQWIEKFYPIKKFNKNIEFFNLIKLDFSVNNYSLFNDTVFEKSNNSKATWVPIFSLKKYLSILKERIVFLKERFNLMLFSYNLDDDLYKIVYIQPKVVSYLLSEFLIKNYDYTVVEYLDCFYDIKNKLVVKNKIVNTRFFVKKNFLENSASELNAGVYGDVPNIVNNNAILIFFSDDFERSEIDIFILQEMPKVIPETLILIALGDFYMSFYKRSIPYCGFLKINVIGNNNSIFSLDDYKWFIFIAINNQKSLILN